MVTARKRRRLQFSLRTLLVFFVVAALLFGYLASLWQAHQKKVALVRAVEARGGGVDVEAVGPDWVRRIGGYHKYGIHWNPRIGIFDRIEGVRFRHGDVTDDFLPRLAGFPHLKSLNLNRTAITNEGMGHVARLASLEELNLSYTAITDDCLPQVGKLARLRELTLGHTRVCGRGFHRLEALPNLFASPRRVWRAPRGRGVANKVLQPYRKMLVSKVLGGNRWGATGASNCSPRGLGSVVRFCAKKACGEISSWTGFRRWRDTLKRL